jgi:hypothetical protein
VKNIQYRLVDDQGNNVEGQYIHHFDQIKTGFENMMNLLTDYFTDVGLDIPEIYSLAANYNSLRAAGFDDCDVYSMLTLAMDEIARSRAATKLAARQEN